MSTDRNVTEHLVTTLEDGRRGLLAATARLRDNGAEALADRFEALAERRADMREELVALAHSYGDRIDGSGSMLGTIHRGWMAVSDAMSGSSVDGVLGAAVEGERHTTSQFDHALVDTDISAGLRSMLRLHVSELRAVQHRLEDLSPAG